jgi:2-polyprenyl-6-hydroxyphenyl methylase/3-demethylubiquinone-9 3-methyltransferase
MVVLAASGLCAAGALVALGLATGRGSHRLDPAALGWSHATAPEAAEYAYTGDDPGYAQTYVRPVVEGYLTDVPREARVLDLGCGSGALLASFHDRGWISVGVDISASGIEQARRAHPTITFVLADATGDLTALLGKSNFDVVISTETIEHVALPRPFVRNAFDALKPGGTLVVSTPYHGYLKNVATAVLARADSHYDPLWDYGHLKFFSVRTLAHLLWDAGFTDLEYTGAGRVPYFWKSMVVRARKPRVSGQP